MGSLLHPVGPLPPGAYWLRRALALVVLVVIVVAVGWAVRAVAGPGTDKQAGAGPPSSPAALASSPTSAAPSSPVAASSPTPAKSATPTASARPTDTASATASASTAPLCADAQLSIAVRTDHPTYPAGQQPKFTLAVRNTGTRDCRRNVGQDALELRVISGGVEVWSSDHCSPGGASDLRTLTPGQTFTATVQWARVSSQPGCPANQPSAAAGSYSVVARDLTLVSPPATFTLQ
ncbi:MAG TPA: hypothetical protein VIM19_08730 [Actinomycetes bacterium]